MDPLYGTGSASDGLALTDSSGGSTDLGSLWGAPTETSSPDPNAGAPLGTFGASAAPSSGSYWTQPASNGGGISGGPSPANGFSGSTLPSLSSGGLGSLISNAWNAFVGVSAVQAQQKAAAVAQQPLVTRFGLANSAGQVSSTGMIVLAGGGLLLALLILRR